MSETRTPSLASTMALRGTDGLADRPYGIARTHDGGEGSNRGRFATPTVAPPMRPNNSLKLTRRAALSVQLALPAHAP